MQTTLKHIDVGSAFRVGIVLYGLLMLIFGLVYVLFQGALLSIMARSIPTDSFNGASALLTGGIVTSCIFYGLLVVFGGIFGGIQGAILAFFYNRTANWIGGLKIELQSDDHLLDDIERDTYTPKRSDL